MLRFRLCLLFLFTCCLVSAAEDLSPVIVKDDLDPATFAEWMDGKETLIGPDRRREVPSWLVWTRDSEPGVYGQEYGDGKKPGPRHMRIGFTKPVVVGTVFACANDLSVLKTSATYPGNLGDDSQWVKAQCLSREGKLVDGNAPPMATWVLPPGTTTRALRMSHMAQQNDRRYNGWTGAVMILPQRYVNLAPQAVASASANSEAAGRVNDQEEGGPWANWENGEQGQEFPVSAEHPAWVMLSWAEPHVVSGLITLSAGASQAEVQVCTAPADQHPTQVPESAWTTILESTRVDPHYPRNFPRDILAFDKPVTTRGVRLRFLKTFDDANCHGHINGFAKGGKRVWLGELLALSPLGDKPLAAAPQKKTGEDHPPIPIAFHLDKPGVVTLVIEDAEGNRIRNLVAETRFPAGDNTAWWDGLDDRERDYEAADHHQYRIPGRLVAPAGYRVRGLVRDEVTLTYDASFYTHGNPAWDTADGTGGWLANHTPPQACAFVPPGMTGDGKAVMLIGSPITEGGSGLAWVDPDGRKLGGIGWIGGNWTGAAHLAVDRGAKRFPGFYAYVASAAEGELRLTGLRPDGGNAGVIDHWKFPNKDAEGCNGIAVNNGLLVASLPKLNAVLLVEVAYGRVLGLLPCPDPRGVAFDAQGRLLLLSGTHVLRASLPADVIARVIGKPIERTGWTASASSGNAALAIDDADDSRWDTQHPQKPGDWFQVDLGRRQGIGRLWLDSRRSGGDFPRGYEIQVSDDGAAWSKPVAAGVGTAVTDVVFTGVQGRYIRVVSTGSDPGAFWSIHQFNVYGPATGFSDLGATPVVTGLEDPRGICADAKGIYVSDQGHSHQVKVFNNDGTVQRTIGKAGPPTVGPYDQLHMNNPVGLTLDGSGRLWVAESDYQPKRVSVWKPDGTLDRAFYGPAHYGCGGSIDAEDPTRLFYSGMELALDRKAGTDVVKNIIWRGGFDVGPAPERVLHVEGREYLTNAYNINPTGGAGVVGIFQYAGGIAKPIACAGRAQWWGPVAERFEQRLGEFSVRWTGKVVPTISGTVTFHTVSDDGVRLWIDGKQLIDNWTGHGPTEDTGSATLIAGKPVDIRLEWFQGAGGASMHLLWSGTGLPKAVIPATQLIPAVAAGAKAAGPGGLRGEYHGGHNLDQLKFTRTDATIDIDIPAGGGIDIPGKADSAAAFRARLPVGTDFNHDALFFVWSDRNHDGTVSADEVSFTKDEVGGVTVQTDLSLATATSLYLKPSGFDTAGIPLYDAATAKALVPGGRVPNTSGGGNTLVCADGWTVLTTPPEPFPVQSSLSGAKDGVLRWTYPSLWPGLHPSHASPVPDMPGELIGTTRVIGPQFKPTGSDVGWCWAINGNQGSIYVFTSDGLFVATLFKDGRTASGWAMPVAQRGMHLEETTIGQENFWPTITQTADGGITLLSGSCIVRVGGLESCRRLSATALPISAAQLAQAASWTLEQEAKRQREQGGGTLVIPLRSAPPTVDGSLDDWAGAAWATIDRRQVQAGDWGSRLDIISGAVSISGDRLYAAWRTGDGNLLRNAGTTWQTLFKFGGCLDLMIGADPAADPKRQEPVAGDCRLLVTMVKDKPLAVLYRPVVPGHTGEKAAFTSPVSSIAMDEVVRVDEQILLAGKDGNYELSVPLALLGLKPVAGQMLKADIGILRGNGFQTMQRCYWSNKATAMTADVPSEARLIPLLWGRWQFAAAP